MINCKSSQQQMMYRCRQCTAVYTELYWQAFGKPNAKPWTKQRLIIQVTDWPSPSFANSLTWGLPVTVFHSMCIFGVYHMVLYWPTLQFYVCVYVLFACQWVAPPGECYYNTQLCCDNFESSSVASHAFSVLFMYSKFGHHPHPLGYLSAKFHFCHGLHCWAKLRTQLLNHSAYLMSREPKLALQNIYTVSQKNAHIFIFQITLSNVNRF